MRRSRLGLAVLVALVVLCGGYAALWYYVAAQIKSGAVAWRDAQSIRSVDVVWRDLRVSGFPLGWRVVIDDAVLRDRRRRPAPELHAARLLANTHPWSLARWRLTAPAGLTADLAAAPDRPSVKVQAQRADGTAMPAPGGGISLWFKLHEVAVTAATGEVPVKSADVWLTLPAARPKTDADPGLALAFDLRQMRVPEPPIGFTTTLDELALGVTVKGPLPEGPLAPALAAWRDAGGTIDVDRLRIEWGGLGVTANGTVALDRALQPMAAFSGGFEGFDTVISALVAADWLTEEQAALVHIALNTLARPGPDGKPQIVAPFTIQNGRVFIGPARLGRIPRIVWD